MYVVGGQDFGIMSHFYNDVWKSEDGFLCEPQPTCELPYFNHVWRCALPSP